MKKYSYQEEILIKTYLKQLIANNYFFKLINDDNFEKFKQEIKEQNFDINFNFFDNRPYNYQSKIKKSNKITLLNFCAETNAPEQYHQYLIDHNAKITNNAFYHVLKGKNYNLKMLYLEKISNKKLIKDLQVKPNPDNSDYLADQYNYFLPLIIEEFEKNNVSLIKLYCQKMQDYIAPSPFLEPIDQIIVRQILASPITDDSFFYLENLLLAEKFIELTSQLESNPFLKNFTGKNMYDCFAGLLSHLEKSQTNAQEEKIRITKRILSKITGWQEKFIITHQLTPATSLKQQVKL